MSVSITHTFLINDNGFHAKEDNESPYRESTYSNRIYSHIKINKSAELIINSFKEVYNITGEFIRLNA